MSARGRPEFERLEGRLGYVFADRGLANTALTHLSVSAAQAPGQSYQRLEFLGDRVLGLSVAEMLYREFPNASEGELSIRLAQLVRRETCAEVALEWDVGPHVQLGPGEARAGGRKKAAILGDVCEALIGAVFLDGGAEAARALVERAWVPRMTANIAPVRDAKTSMQEWAQGRALPAPTYREVARTGPAHAPSFVMEVVLEGFETTQGEGASKRLAEQTAAQSFLDKWART